MGTPKSFTFNLRAIIGNLFRRLLAPRVYARLQFGSALGLAVGFVLLALIVSNLLGTKSSRLSDLFYQPPPPSSQVVIVALDDASIRAVGELPWSRTVLAQLIDNLAHAQPRVIGLDQALVGSADDDDRLANALARAPTIVQPIVAVDGTRVRGNASAPPRLGVALLPSPDLLTDNTQLGHALFIPDDDDIVRRVPLVIESNHKQYPAFGLAVLEAYSNQSLDLQIQNGVAWLGETRLPVDAQGQMELNFFETRQTISAVDVLRGRANLAMLRDKIVLVGETGSVTSTMYATPVSLIANVHPIHLHGDLIETILTNRTLVKQDRLTEIVMVFLLAISAGATLPHFRTLSATGLTIIYFLLYVGYAFAKFNEGVIVQPLYPALALGLALIGAMTYRYFSEERYRNFITLLLRRYLAPETVDAVTENFDSGLLMRSIRREVSVLAIDLSELEPLAGSLTAVGLVRLLDNYVSLIVKVIFHHDGSVVKQTGSAILAAWNFLIDQPAHAEKAVRAAIDLRHEIAEFNRTLPKELTIRVGMGVATGNVTAGRIGASPRAEYTIIGEVVGMAERIALKPERGVFIDVTTRERLGDAFDMLQVKSVRLRRKTDPAQVWLLVEPTETRDDLLDEPVVTSEIPK